MGYFYLVLIMNSYGVHDTTVIPKPYYGLEACQVAGEVTKSQETGDGTLAGFYCVPGKPLEND